MPVKESQIYRRLKLIGEGSFGKAYLVESMSDGQLLVVKQMDLQFMAEEEKQEAYKEARILGQLKHPNIINFREVYKTKKGRLCIVMDYADGGDLSQKIKAQGNQELQEQQILDWFTQMCLAIKHVHDRKIIHRDIKTQNIFLTKDGRIKLGDFGIARVLSHTREKVKTIVGTPYYLAPELIENKPYSFSGDMWSLGVVLYELCARKTPFDADNLPLLALKIVNGKFQQIPHSYSKELKNLVANLLTVNENHRPTVYQVLKLPIITNRIKNFLSETMRAKEFAHTILHNHNILVSPVASMKVMEDIEKKQIPKGANYGSPQNDRKVHKPSQVLPQKKPQTPGLFPDIKKDVQTPKSKQGLRVGTPVIGKHLAIKNDRKTSGDDREIIMKVRLPEIKMNFGKAVQKEQDARQQIFSRANVPQTPKEREKNRKIQETAQKKPILVKQPLRESQEELDQQQILQIQLPENENSNIPVQQNFFGGVPNDNHPQLSQVNNQMVRPKYRLLKSPSAFDGIIKCSASDRLARLKARVINKGSRFLVDGDKEVTPSHNDNSQFAQPMNKQKIKIHIGRQQIEKIFQNNQHAQHFAVGSPLFNLMDQDLNLDHRKDEDPLDTTLQKISEHGSDRRSNTKLSISIPNDETVKSSYMLSIQRNTTLEEQAPFDNQSSVFSLTKSVIIGNQTVRWQPEKLSLIEQPTFYEKIDPKKRKIIFKDPFSRLDSNNQVKQNNSQQQSLKRDDSEEDLKLIVKELQGIVKTSQYTEQISPSDLQNQDLNLHNNNIISSSSYEDSSSDEQEVETKIMSPKKVLLENHPLQTLDYICGNKEIKHLKDQLKHKLNRHFNSVYGLAKEVYTYEDLGKNSLTKKIRELIPNTDQKTAEGVATLIVTLVVLARGEAISAL